MRRSHTTISFAVFFILGIGELFAPSTARAQESDLITYQGAEIKPGDVINFLGGEFTKVPGLNLTYGHSALYLGVDPQTGHRSFLDFHAGTPDERAFSGEILPELDFLTYNTKEHPSFDVFRLQNASTLNQHRLLQEAKTIAKNDTWGIRSEVCSDAVAKALSKATGTTIVAKTPDYFLSPPFQRHPQLTGRSINIQAALREAKALQAVDARSAQLQNLVPQMVAARRVAHRTSLTLEEYAALSEVRRQQLLYAQLDYLRTLVGYACSDPGDLGTLNDEGRVAGVSLAHKDLRAYVDGASAHMSRCEKQIYANIFESVGAASIQSLAAWGITYRSEHNVIVDVKHFLDKIAKYCAEVVGAFASLGDAFELPSDGYNSSSSSNTSSVSDHSASSPNNWSTLNDLRGISASGGIWPQ
jgi:hypothetical protein